MDMVVHKEVDLVAHGEVEIGGTQGMKVVLRTVMPPRAPIPTKRTITRMRNLVLTKRHKQ